MGSSIFNLNEEIFDNCSIESSIFAILSISVLFLWFLNIISAMQFIFLFVFYIFWIIIVFYSKNKLEYLMEEVEYKTLTLLAKIYDYKKILENKFN